MRARQVKKVIERLSGWWDLWRGFPIQVICLTTAIVISAIWANSAFAASSSPQELAEAAKRQAAQAADRAAKVKPAEVADAKRVEEVAETGTARGKAEFERRAAMELAKHEAAVAKANGGEQKSAVTPNPKAPLAGRLVVAISSSMPDEMVREYMRQLDGVPEAIVVLRGFVNGARAVGPTGKWLERVRRKVPSCTGRECAYYRVDIVVDPLAYQMLGIEKVPAFTYLPGVQDLRHCDADVLASGSVAYGATSVAAALKSVRANGVAVPDELLAGWGGRT